MVVAFVVFVEAECDQNIEVVTVVDNAVDDAYDIASVVADGDWVGERIGD